MALPGVSFLSIRSGGWCLLVLLREAGAQSDARPCLSRGRLDTRVGLPQPCPGSRGARALPRRLEMDRLGTPLYFSDRQRQMPPPRPAAGTASFSLGRHWGCPGLGRHGSDQQMGPFVFASELPGISG